MKFRVKNIRFSDKTLKIIGKALQYIDFFIIVLSLIGFLTVLYDVGFKQDVFLSIKLHTFYSFCLFTFFIAFFVKLVLQTNTEVKPGRRISEYSVFFALLLIVVGRLNPIESLNTLFSVLNEHFFINLVFLIIFIIEISKYSLRIFQFQVHPALLFIVSFFLLILAGTGLLLLPQATVEEISLVDAVFTATSAVCVTGLIVVDTATYFTTFGKTIILILFQIGGLGFMTFSSFFGFFFKGSYSLQHQLFLKDYINEENIGEISKTLVRIMVFTFVVELLGAIFIFFSLDSFLTDNSNEKIRFAVFHAISAFCNAGFSTLSNGLFEEGVRHNYHLHLIVAVIIVIGGIGFPVIINFYKYLENVSVRVAQHIVKREAYRHAARDFNVNTKIVVSTTAALLVIGFLAFFTFEYNHALQGLSGYGKVVTTIFGAVTPRTAGFNTVDMTALTLPTVLIYLILMWIGASPGGTGGGLKTTTFAVAVLNALSIAKGKNRVEAFRREITNESVRKAFAVILLSFLIIGLAVFLMMFFDPEKELIAVAFECFSAFSTVGLSLGITGSLSTGSKIVISITMFLGRVGMLTLLVAFFRKVKSLNYRYPDESVFIS